MSPDKERRESIENRTGDIKRKSETRQEGLENRTVEFEKISQNHTALMVIFFEKPKIAHNSLNNSLGAVLKPFLEFLYF